MKSVRSCLLLILSSAIALGQSTSLFQNAITYGSGGYLARSVAVADVNGDGKPDLVVANWCGSSSNCTSSNGTVDVLLGNGDGTFQAAVSYDAGSGGAFSIAIADVNGDGKPDLLVANCGCSNGTVGVLLGNGDGTFQSVVTYGSGGEGATSIVVADVNGDGKPDLLVVNSCTSDGYCSQGIVGVLLGNGNGTFQSALTFESGGAGETSFGTSLVAVADVNGDGKPDLVVANFCGNGNDECTSDPAAPNGTVGVLLGNGDGTFQAAVTYDSGGVFATSVAVADVNGDGKLDIVTSNYCDSRLSSGQCPSDSTVGVLLGNGDGTFQAVVSYSAGDYLYGAEQVAVADVNGDGKPDLLVAFQCAIITCANGAVGVMLGNGDGTFQSALSYDSGGLFAYSVAVADVNGDGKPDLVVANTCVGVAGNGCTGAGVVGVLMNSMVILSQTYFDFPNQPVGVSSVPQNVTLTNTGKITLTISSIGITGTNSADFSQTNTCGTSVSAGNSCTISQVFTPTATGTRNATVNIVDSAAGSPQTITLTGVGVVNGPVASIKPTSLTFGPQMVATTSPSQSVTLFNTGSTSLTVSSVSTSGDFAVSTNYCMKGVQPNTHCSILVTFTPTASGTRNGTLVINDNGVNSTTQTATLTGTGVTTPVSTSVSISASPNPSSPGQTVTLTATVISVPGGTPTGTVTFTYGTTTLGVVTLSTSEIATLKTSSLPPGSDQVEASYSGDATFSPSGSTITQVVTQGTTTSLTSSPNPSYAYQPVTFTATVTPAYGGTPTGTVTFTQGSTTLATVTLINGQASFTTTFTSGTFSITASYSGNVNYIASKSSVLKQVVNKGPTTTTLTSSPNPSTSGQSVTFTATVSAQYAGTPTGTVTFKNGSTGLGTSTLVGGIAIITTSKLPKGSDKITATYNGTANFTSSSATLTQTVN